MHAYFLKDLIVKKGRIEEKLGQESNSICHIISFILKVSCTYCYETFDSNEDIKN